MIRERIRFVYFSVIQFARETNYIDLNLNKS